MRLFIAVEIPEIISNIIHSFQDSIVIPGRATKTKSFHLTLKFLGDIDEAKVSDLKAQLSKIEFNSFEAFLSDLGAFPDINNPRVLWIGLEPEDKINILQKAVESSTANLGFPKDTRFHPHLTLARIKSLDNKAEFKDTLASIIPPKATFQVSEFNLIKSTLTPQGPVYEVLYVFKSSG